MGEKGYIQTQKIEKGKRQTTIYRLTPSGSDVLDTFIDTLRGLMRGD